MLFASKPYLKRSEIKQEEPFTKVGEWFDSQVIIEGVYPFPILRLNSPVDYPPPFARGSRKIGKKMNGRFT
jgi:hypothetical protein